MNAKHTEIPDSSAVRTALWRALHVEIDGKPPVFEDVVGLEFVNPPEDWRNRGDMHPIGTRTYRASIVGRARFVEDLLEEKIKLGVKQYLILGAGLDSFVQRKPKSASSIQTFEVDKADTQSWKKQRLIDLGYGLNEYQRFVSVNFEAGDSLWSKLEENAFDVRKMTLVASTGVAMYLSKEAVIEKLRKIAELASGSVLVMSYMLPLDLIDPSEREQLKVVQEKAKAAGTPFMSTYRPEELIKIALEAGFKTARSISTSELKYFDDREDGLRPSTGESILIAET